jgi:hypothetical protein
MATDRVLAQDVTFALSDTGASPSPAYLKRLVTEVDRFEAEAMPEFEKKWPAGAKKPHHQLVGSSYRVTLECGVTGRGLCLLHDYQNKAKLAGQEVPKLHMVRTYINVDGATITETYRGGIVTTARDSQGEGSTSLSTSATIEFEDKDNSPGL